MQFSRKSRHFQKCFELRKEEKKSSNCLESRVEGAWFDRDRSFRHSMHGSVQNLVHFKITALKGDGRVCIFYIYFLSYMTRE